MQKVKVSIKATPKNNYNIHIDSGFIDSIADLFDISEYSQLFIISDSNVSNYYLDRVINSYNRANPKTKINHFIFPAGEKSKNLESFRNIHTKLAEVGFDRKGIILNLGGGVTTDMGGFVASTYQRGVDFFNISTSVEGMVDASVGGKTGINLDGYKNYIGLFNHPNAIFIDISTLETLPERELIAGFAEIIKHGIIKDKEYFYNVTKKAATAFSNKELEDIVKRSCEIKAAVVKVDEKEKGQRRLLNYGHTVGHAIETASFSTSARYLHGEAVAIGTVAATKVSELMGLITTDTTLEIEQAIVNSGLPTRVKTEISERDILDLLKYDKKVEAGKINWTLINGIGEGSINQFVPKDVTEEAVRYVCGR